MKLTIHDRNSLSMIRPLDAISYLRATGWTKVLPTTTDDRISIWLRRDDRGEEVEAVVPVDQTARDYALRIGDLIRSIEAVEDRSQVEIHKALMLTAADVIRIRLIDPELSDGSVAIDEGAEVFPKVRDLMLSAACSAVRTKAYYPSKKPNQALEYLRHVRLGQTEVGSFVMTVISKVPPALGASDGVLIDVFDEPFERRVTQILASGLMAIKSAVTQAATDRTIDGFVKHIDRGVSANLCDALVGLAKDQEGDRQLEFSFGWSANRPIERAIEKIRFSPDAFPTISEAARHLKETASYENYELSGYVVKLDSDQPQQSGRVTVASLVEGVTKKITFELSGNDYTQAVEAHRDGKLVQCRGSLRRETRRFSLEQVNGFTSVDEDD